MSWFSRLLASTTRTSDGSDPGPVTTGAGEEIRLGLDFGTSTTLVAVRIGNRPPRVLRLERSSDEMPSYISMSNGVISVGQAAMNAGAHVHSVKLRLRKNEPIDELEGMEPAKAALEMVREATLRALEQLKREGRLPPTASQLTVATNVGCTPAFDLTQRARLRDVCRHAGLQVGMVNLIEEPVAAGYEVVQSAGISGGVTLVIDIGGGTLDVAVMDVQKDGTDFVIYATGGRALAGDDLTRLIETRLRAELAQQRGIPISELSLSRQEETALWLRSEAAKKALTDRRSVRVALPETSEEVEITRDWFEQQARPIIDQMVAFVTSVYRQSRLTLDRGGPRDPYPGTDVLEADENGVILKKLSSVDLQTDGREHIDVAYLVGGAGHTPIIKRRFEEILRGRLQDLGMFAIDPVHSVVLGLARHASIEHIEMRHPNWGVMGRLRTDGVTTDPIDIYEPYAPLFKLNGQQTSQHTVTIPVAPEHQGGSLNLEFRPVIKAPGTAWEPIRLPDHADSFTVAIDLFGRVRVTAGGEVLAYKPSPFTPATLPDWILGKPPVRPPDLCWHSQPLGHCGYLWCPHHPNGGVNLYQN